MSNVAEHDAARRLTVEVSEPVKKLIKSTAALKGQSMGEYITDLALKDQAKDSGGNGGEDSPNHSPEPQRSAKTL